jgi:hypothetical protein
MACLKTAWEAFVDEQPYGISIEADPDPTCYLFRFEIFRPIPARISAIAGDILHNLRSSLDHFVTALVQQRESGEGRNAFPIYTSEKALIEDVRDRPKKRGPGPLHGIAVDSDEWAFIERAQPYQRRDSPKAHPLAVLADLSNRDKHRILNPTYVAPAAPLKITWDPRAILAEQKNFIRAGVRHEHNAKLLWLRFDQRGANPNVRVDGCIPFGVAFGDSGVTLLVIRDAVSNIVSEAEAFFPPPN